MTTASMVLLGASVPLIALVALQWWLARQSRATVGGPVPPGGPDVGDGTALVYFFSPTCGPCRAMAPDVDALIAAGKPIHKVDVSRTPEAAMAWSVMATPTTVLVREGRVMDVLVGALPRARLERMLADGSQGTASPG